MSSISTAYSPLQMLQSTLTSQVSSGTISSTDQSALSSALSDIDTALKSQMEAGGTRPSSEEMKAKIDDLIANEVSEGDLTTEQADELKEVFAATFQGAAGAAGGVGGPPPGPPPSEEEDEDDTSTSSTSSSTDVSELLQEFLKKLQESQSANATYGSDGTNVTSEFQSLLVNYSA